MHSRGSSHQRIGPGSDGLHIGLPGPPHSTKPPLNSALTPTALAFTPSGSSLISPAQGIQHSHSSSHQIHGHNVSFGYSSLQAAPQQRSSSHVGFGSYPSASSNTPHAVNSLNSGMAAPGAMSSGFSRVPAQVYGGNSVAASTAGAGSGLGSNVGVSGYSSVPGNSSGGMFNGFDHAGTVSMGTGANVGGYSRPTPQDRFADSQRQSFAPPYSLSGGTADHGPALSAASSNFVPPRPSGASSGAAGSLSEGLRLEAVPFRPPASSSGAAVQSGTTANGLWLPPSSAAAAHLGDDEDEDEDDDDTHDGGRALYSWGGNVFTPSGALAGVTHTGYSTVYGAAATSESVGFQGAQIHTGAGAPIPGAAGAIAAVAAGAAAGKHVVADTDTSSEHGPALPLSSTSSGSNGAARGSSASNVGVGTGALPAPGACMRSPLSVWSVYSPNSIFVTRAGLSAGTTSGSISALPGSSSGGGSSRGSQGAFPPTPAAVSAAAAVAAASSTGACARDCGLIYPFQAAATATASAALVLNTLTAPSAAAVATSAAATATSHATVVMPTVMSVAQFEAAFSRKQPTAGESNSSPSDAPTSQPTLANEPCEQPSVDLVSLSSSLAVEGCPLLPFCSLRYKGKSISFKAGDLLYPAASSSATTGTNPAPAGPLVDSLVTAIWLRSPPRVCARPSCGQPGALQCLPALRNGEPPHRCYYCSPACLTEGIRERHSPIADAIMMGSHRTPNAVTGSALTKSLQPASSTEATDGWVSLAGAPSAASTTSASAVSSVAAAAAAGGLAWFADEDEHPLLALELTRRRTAPTPADAADAAIAAAQNAANVSGAMGSAAVRQLPSALQWAPFGSSRHEALACRYPAPPDDGWTLAHVGLSFTPGPAEAGCALRLLLAPAWVVPTAGDADALAAVAAWAAAEAAAAGGPLGAAAGGAPTGGSSTSSSGTTAQAPGPISTAAAASAMADAAAAWVSAGSPARVGSGTDTVSFRGLTFDASSVSLHCAPATASPADASARAAAARAASAALAAAPPAPDAAPATPSPGSNGMPGFFASPPPFALRSVPQQSWSPLCAASPMGNSGAHSTATLPFQALDPYPRLRWYTLALATVAPYPWQPPRRPWLRPDGTEVAPPPPLPGPRPPVAAAGSMAPMVAPPAQAGSVAKQAGWVNDVFSAVPSPPVPHSGTAGATTSALAARVGRSARARPARPRAPRLLLPGSSLRVLCYNILSPTYATASLYGYCPSWALSWDYRCRLILDEIVFFRPSVICLQEVQGRRWTRDLLPALAPHGYRGIFKPKDRGAAPVPPPTTPGGTNGGANSTPSTPMSNSGPSSAVDDNAEGCAILWNTTVATLRLVEDISFDDFAHGNGSGAPALRARQQKRVRRGNNALAVVLDIDTTAAAAGGGAASASNAAASTTSNDESSSATGANSSGGNSRNRHRRRGGGSGVTSTPAAASAGTSNNAGMKRVVIANTHIYWDPEYADVKLWQSWHLTRALERVLNNARALGPPTRAVAGSGNASGTTPEKGSAPTPQAGASAESAETSLPALVLCGDFNSVPSSSVYSLLAKASVPAHHPVLRADKEAFNILPPASQLTHSLGLTSAYAATTGSEPRFTNYTGHFRGTLDYIFHTSERLICTGVLAVEAPSILAEHGALPSVKRPSDHVPLLAEFAWPDDEEEGVEGIKH